MQVWQPQNISAICPPQISGCSDFAVVYLSLLVQLYGGSVDQKKHEMCDRETKPEAWDGKEYDFIVVGAGAAGCVVANRLTENYKWKVLLLEAGPEEPDITRVPSLISAVSGSNIDWQYTTEPNGKSCLALPGGRCTWPRGKTMGGSTSTNGFGYIRGNREDYDSWARLGNKGWSYEDVLPFFMKSETNMNKYAVDSDYHGAKGEQYVSWLPYVDDASNMMMEAYTEGGIPLLDYNGAEQLGAMQMQAFALEGERVSTNVAFIQPIRHKRPNLFIETNSEAIKILIDDHKNANGIVYLKDAKKYTAYAKKEVIISGGTINSPKLLMLSGIGPKEHLKSLNIPVVKDLAVGENLHDHLSFDGLAVALSNETVTAVSQQEILRAVKELAEMKIKRGPLSALGPVLSSSFLKTKPYLIAPDIQYQVVPLPNLREYLRDPLAAAVQYVFTPMSYYDAVMPRAMNLVPKSRGKLLLNKTNPYGPPLLHVNYLGDDSDLIPLMKGVRFLLSLENTEAFQSRGAYFVREKMPHCKEYDWGTDEYFVCLIRHYTSTTHHQVGTCKMGPAWDKKAVVDSELRVYGVKRLRVIDASIMPVVIRGNTEAPAIMIGERGVDFVIKYWQNLTKDYCF
ncbi:glucose dehydrogenase [FAD, quinone]-like [Maniola hyperantus]|uniref:glucose dehydrogenase [FAD, quinone]-like n=1 Tax=Aphantopus hyperantus TaxID=2795564 RepID=UPI0015693C48|nr:glucose dehydrogenase [FAD, quinone]-like [Maniola hyperantus]